MNRTANVYDAARIEEARAEYRTASAQHDTAICMRDRWGAERAQSAMRAAQRKERVAAQMIAERGAR